MFNTFILECIRILFEAEMIQGVTIMNDILSDQRL